MPSNDRVSCEQRSAERAHDSEHCHIDAIARQAQLYDCEHATTTAAKLARASARK